MKFTNTTVKLPHHPYDNEKSMIDCSYFGETTNGIPHGLGQIKCKEFEGYAKFNKGLLHGESFILSDNMKELRTCNFENGIRTGYIKNNLRYAGEY